MFVFPQYEYTVYYLAEASDMTSSREVSSHLAVVKGWSACHFSAALEVDFLTKTLFLPHFAALEIGVWSHPDDWRTVSPQRKLWLITKTL